MRLRARRRSSCAQEGKPEHPATRPLNLLAKRAPGGHLLFLYCDSWLRQFWLVLALLTATSPFYAILQQSILQTWHSVCGHDGRSGTITALTKQTRCLSGPFRNGRKFDSEWRPARTKFVRPTDTGDCWAYKHRAELRYKWAGVAIRYSTNKATNTC